MRTPRILRTTPFRLTLVFLALFAGGASAFLAYIYLATAGEVTRRADESVSREMAALERVYQRGGVQALNHVIIERGSGGAGFLYLLMNGAGAPISGTIGRSPVSDFTGKSARSSFTLADWDANGMRQERPARGLQERLAGGEILFVGADVGEAESFVGKILRAVWGAGALVIVLGLAGGVVVSRDVNRTMAGLTSVIDAVRGGDLAARARMRGAGDEFDDLALGLNDMLDRLERSIAGLRHAGDAIAHDLRSPVTRLRAHLEAALIDSEAGRADPKAALRHALDDADGVLRTFTAVLSIARLEAALEAPNPTQFDPGELARDVAELYQPLCDDKGLDFRTEVASGLTVCANREFIAQAIANVLDNAVKYTPEGGAVMLRVRRRTSGDIEISVTDTGPGVRPDDRTRVVERFVRLDSSRNQPGAGLGLSLVDAVARAHRGQLELDEGPGMVDGSGPGLRVALVLPKGG